MSPKTIGVSQSNTLILLIPVDGNRRPKSGRAKPLRKEKKSIVQI